MTDQKKNECIGWLGKIFGHKYKTFDQFHSTCLRCGRPRG